MSTQPFRTGLCITSMIRANFLRCVGTNQFVIAVNFVQMHPISLHFCCIFEIIAPFFDDFVLVPETKGENEVIRLEWRQKGSDFPFQAYQLSDGTIRFICLATALLQPRPPATILFDEPELGLHPYAISMLAGLLQSTSERTQVIISTQSPTLLDHFEPENIVVVNRVDGRSEFNRLDEKQLGDWLDEYSVGE